MRESSSILEGLHVSRINEGGLKLADLEKEVKDRLEKKISKDRLVNYANQLKKSGNYKQFSVRFVNDVKSALFKPEEICDWYGTYGCTDKHITSLFLKVMKEYEKKNKVNLYLDEFVNIVIDEAPSIVEYRVSKKLVADCKNKYKQLQKILDSSKISNITELADAIEKAFKLVGGIVNIYKQSQTYLRYDGKVKTYTLALGVGVDGFELPMAVEDLIMAYFKMNGGEGNYTSDFIAYLNGKEPKNGSVYIEESKVEEATSTSKDFDGLVKAVAILKGLNEKYKIADNKEDVKGMRAAVDKMRKQFEEVQDILVGIDEVINHYDLYVDDMM